MHEAQLPLPSLLCCCPQNISDRGHTAAAILLSYLDYPFFNSQVQGLVLSSLAALAPAAALAAPATAFVDLLPRGSEGGLSPSIRAAVASAISVTTAEASPALFAAACDAVLVALSHHASLLDALMFPSKLEDKATGQASGLEAWGLGILLITQSFLTGVTAIQPCCMGRPRLLMLLFLSKLQSKKASPHNVCIFISFQTRGAAEDWRQ